jgi:hypothetical protein
MPATKAACSRGSQDTADALLLHLAMTSFIIDLGKLKARRGTVPVTAYYNKREEMQTLQVACIHKLVAFISLPISDRDRMNGLHSQQGHALMLPCVSVCFVTAMTCCCNQNERITKQHNCSKHAMQHLTQHTCSMLSETERLSR